MSRFACLLVAVAKVGSSSGQLQQGSIGQNAGGDILITSAPNGTIRMNEVDVMSSLSTMQSTIRMNEVDIMSSFSTMQSTITSQESTIASLVRSSSTMAERLAEFEGMEERMGRMGVMEDRFNRAFAHMFAPSTSPTTSGPTSSPSASPSSTPSTTRPTAAPTIGPSVPPTVPCGTADANDNGLLDDCEQTGGTWTSQGAFEWSVPEGASTAHISVKGARGWKRSDRPGGDGGITTGLLDLAGIRVLHIVVGGPGTAASGANLLRGGGFNGGGNGRNNGVSNTNVGGGGGSSDVRLARNDLASRIIVAGGGGSATGNSCNAPNGCIGGNGGGLRGQDAPQHNTAGQHTGKGGTQSAGGAFGGQFHQGGHGSAGTPWNGGGGGGWYGGGSSVEHAGGGGGSSYANSTLIRDSVLTQGGNDGSGWVQIRWSTQI